MKNLLNDIKKLSIFDYLFIFFILCSISFILGSLELSYTAFILILLPFMLFLLILVFMKMDKDNNLNKLSNYIIILFFAFGYVFSIICVFCIDLVNGFAPATICATDNINKALEIQKFVGEQGFEGYIGKFEHLYPIEVNFNVKNNEKFDKLAIALAESDVVDDTVKIGINYLYTDNPKLGKTRIEKNIKRRINKIDGVKFVKVDVIIKSDKNKDYLTNGTVINVVADIEDGSKKDFIYKVIYNLLPVDKQNKSIQINVL